MKIWKENYNTVNLEEILFIISKVIILQIL